MLQLIINPETGSNNKRLNEDQLSWNMEHISRRSQGQARIAVISVCATPALSCFDRAYSHRMY